MISIKIRTALLLIAITAFAKTAVGQVDTSKTYTSTIVDAATKTPIPFATIQYDTHRGVITNEEGVFGFELQTPKQDSIRITSMGYEDRAFSFNTPLDSVIYLTPKTFELKGVFLSTNPLSTKQIIDSVKTNLHKNYATQGLTKKKVFFRQSDLSALKKVDLGFKKSTIPEFNKRFIDSMAMLIPRSSEHYQEMAGDFYGNYNKHKLYIDKAAELYDASKDVSFDGIGDKVERIFHENVKRDSYLKIKSGLFGTKIQLDSILATNEDAQKVAEEVAEKKESHFNQGTVDRISELYEQLIFNEDSKLDILRKSNRYRFVKEDFTYIQGEPVYVISFEPKGRKDFKGTMYVNTNDFAIVRLEFDNVRPLFKFGLLGITYRETVYKGKMLFSKDANGTYNPQYISLEQGSYFGIDRPLKIKEKNKNVRGRRLQNQISLALDIRGTELQKYELVVFNSEAISESVYNSAPQNKGIAATYLPKYDPNFWKGHTIMEPNAAIQAFEVVE